MPGRQKGIVTQMKIRIYTMTHKKFDVPKDPLYQPLHVGRKCTEDLGYPGDDTGDNISGQNCYYSELTGLYWIWKNCRDVDYVGTCHYRRFLVNDREQVLTAAEYETLLREYDLVTTKRVLLNHSYYDGFSANHNREVLDVTGEVIREKYPEYYGTFDRLVNGPETYFGNILVTSKERFDAYAAWLFSIFFEVAGRVNLETGEDAYHKRVFGFISEFLLLVWVRVNGLRVCECKVGMLGEKAETKELKERLAGYFLAGDYEGAKSYFLQRKAERPDVMLEASDVGGELRICMQIIATAGLESQAYGTNVLERENRYRELIALFAGINRVVAKLWNGTAEESDVAFLTENEVSRVAFDAAVRILPEGDPERKKQFAANISDKIFIE